MQPNQSTQPQSTTNTDNPQDQSNPTSKSDIPPTLLSYDPTSNHPSKYNDAGIYATRPNASTSNQQTRPHPQPNPRNQPISAASLTAVMATSSSSTDKMHSQPSSSRKVDDWNEDPTYKSRLASMVGSTRKWNYFGADIGGNPFRRAKK